MLSIDLQTKVKGLTPIQLLRYSNYIRRPSVVHQQHRHNRHRRQLIEHNDINRTADMTYEHHYGIPTHFILQGWLKTQP